MENPQKSNQEELKTPIEIEDYSDQKGSFSVPDKRPIIQALKTLLEKNNFDLRTLEETNQYKNLSRRNIKRLEHYCSFEPLYREMMKEHNEGGKKELSVTLSKEKY